MGTAGIDWCIISIPNLFDRLRCSLDVRQDAKTLDVFRRSCYRLLKWLFRFAWYVAWHRDSHAKTKNFWDRGVSKFTKVWSSARAHSAHRSSAITWPELNRTRRRISSFFGCFLITTWRVLCLLSFKLHQDLQFVAELTNVKTIVLVLTETVCNFGLRDFI